MLQDGPLYKVRWLNYGPSWDTWEPPENLDTCKDLIEWFALKQKQQEKKEKSSKDSKQKSHSKDKKPHSKERKAGSKGKDQKAGSKGKDQKTESKDRKLEKEEEAKVSGQCTY